MARKISIIIPFLNEQSSLQPLTEKIRKVLGETRLSGYRAEIIMVDDGSNDGSLGVVSRLARKYRSGNFVVKAISLVRNCGKTQALNAGIPSADGSIIVMMDADLQDDPKYLPDFVKIIEQRKADLVIGNRTNRYRGNFPKLLASRLVNAIVVRFTKYPIHDINCGFKVMRAEVARSLNLRSDYHRFIPLIAATNGFQVTETEIKQQRRKYGKSKYGKTGLLRFVKSIIDITSILFIHKFRENPFGLFGRAGFALLALGLVVLAYLTIDWFMGIPINGRPLFFLGITFVLTGVNIIVLGLLGELVVQSVPVRPPAVRYLNDKNDPK